MHDNTINLADAGVHVDDLRPAFRELRDHAPVMWTPPRLEPGFWSVTRYDDCVRVQKDTASFTSVQANVLGPQRVHGDPAAGRS